MPIDILIGLMVVGFFLLAALTIAAIVETALESFPNADRIDIYDPAISQELERIASQKSSKPHKRIAYDRQSKRAVVVASNKIADELRGEDRIEIDVR